MSFIERLHLSRKFMVMGLLALLMASLPTGLYLQRSLADVAQAQRQAEGTTPLIALQKVVQLMQQHRGTSAGMLSGNETLAARRPAVRDALNQALKAVDTELAARQALPATTAAWGELKQRWSALEQTVASRQLQTAQSTQQHTHGSSRRCCCSTTTCSMNTT